MKNTESFNILVKAPLLVKLPGQILFKAFKRRFHPSPPPHTYLPTMTMSHSEYL